MAELPAGTVTFLFTDVEGSTRLWEQAPEAMMGALALHDGVIEKAAADHGGHVVKPRGEGDSRFVVFPVAADAVAAAADIQRGLERASWPTPSALRVRIALHTGVAEVESGDYYGSAVNRAARLRSIGHGGQTLISRTTWDLVRDDLPSGVTARDLGQHRLKDLARPEHVFQVDVEGLPTAFAPLVSLDAIPNNLPQQLTAFVGREGELAEAERVLDSARLLTVLGPGGVGKSRLALQAAADRSSAYRNGVFFVSLAPLDSEDEIVPAIAEAIGAVLSTEDDLQSQLLDYLRRKQQLLVLDNFEHLRGGASLVSEILRTAPDISILVTSRTRLGLSGETTLVLSGLDYRWDTPENALQSEAVMLFTAAAQRRRPGFTVGAADLDDLKRILSTLQGMPLAILLSAAWVDTMSLADIADEVTQSLDILEADLGDLPDRHRSIQAVFAYSWRLLTAAEQRLFATLSVFRGGFDRAAAAAVAGASLRDLARLVDKSLLSAEPEAGRYSVHELLRQYAEQALEEDEAAAGEARRRHAEFYGTAMAAAFEVFREGDQVAALASIEDDLENVRTAWRHAMAERDAGAARPHLESLWMLYEIRGWYLAGRMLFTEAASRFADGSDAPVRALTALCTAMASWFAALLGSPDEGRALAADAIAGLRRDGSARDLALALMIQDLSLVFTDVAALRRSIDEGFDAAKRADDAWMTYLLTTWRATCAVMEGDAEAAVEVGDRIRRELGETGHQWVQTWSYQALAGAARLQGRFADAVALFERALALDYEIGFRRGIQYALNSLGVVATEMGEYGGAEEYFLRSLAVSEEIGQTREILHTLCDLAGTRAALGDGEAAVTLIAAALDNPASTQLSAYRSPIDETAQALLSRLESELDPAAYATAWSRGRSGGIEPLVRDLLAGAAVG